jgi:hypothetical protein
MVKPEASGAGPPSKKAGSGRGEVDGAVIVEAMER